MIFANCARGIRCDAGSGRNMSPSSSRFALPELPTLRKANVLCRAIRYCDIGEGPPLVLVHGVGGDADQWAFCFGGLTAHNRLIAFDRSAAGTL